MPWLLSPLIHFFSLSEDSQCLLGTRFRSLNLSGKSQILAALLLTAVSLHAPYCHGQTDSSASAPPPMTITNAQVESAVTGGHLFQSIHMSGRVTRDANPKETVPIDIVISADGSTQITIQASAGAVSETEIATGSDPQCNPPTSVKAGPPDLRDFQCNSIASWIMPTLAIARPNSSYNSHITAFTFAQLDQQTVIAMDLYRKGFTRMVKGHAITTKREERTIYLDSSNQLPTSMQYRVFPREHSQIFVPVKITYSDYRSEKSINTPYRIRKFVSGHLLLDISIESVEVK